MSIVMVALAIAYHVVVTIPAENRQREAARREAELNREVAAAKRQNDLKLCVSNASLAYNADWDNSCKANGEGPDCRLSGVAADLLDKRYRQSREECLQTFPTGQP
jgi:hypothetical protein